MTTAMEEAMAKAALAKPKKDSPTVHDAQKAKLQMIGVADIHVVKNVRKSFDEDKLKELSESIKANGIVQPLLVRPVAGRYELVAGERRLRAAKMAKLEEVPCVVRAMSDALALEAQLIENTHREDMNAVDEAFGVAALHKKLDLTEQVVAERLGRSQGYVSQMIAITTLPRQALDLLRRGIIGKSGAYEIAKQKDRSTQVAVAAALQPEGGEYAWDGTVVSVTKIRAVIRALRSDDQSPQARVYTPQGTTKQDILKFWRFHLLSFSAREFEYFKEICKGRFDTETMAEAVTVVMAGRQDSKG